MEPIMVRVLDPETEEVLGETIIDNDYAIICAGTAHVSYTNVSGSTHTVTIKGTRSSSLSEQTVTSHFDELEE